jgi:tRNA A37 methylthiotransferase MiaB
MPDDVDRAVKKARLATVDGLQQEIQTRNNATLVGNVYNVLVEERKRGRLHGRNRGDKLIYIDTQYSQGPQPGQTVLVEITESSPWSLEAKLVPANYPTQANHANRVSKEKVPVV